MTMFLAAPLYSEDFAGRREELGFLLEEYRAACDGCTRAVTIEGEAGIGKSRLLQELFKSAQPGGTVVGACLEQIRSPYLPWTEILEQIDPPPVRLTHVGQKSEFFEGAAEAIRRRCARAPLIIAIEDLQWADGATLELFAFLLARLVKVPALLIATMRTDAAAVIPALAAFRSTASRRRCAALQLPPLRRNDVRNLVQHILSRRNLFLPANTVSQIEVLAEGNPLFAEELMRIAVENGELALQPHVPVSVGALLGERLASFNEEEQHLLVRAAILGESFDVEMLATIAGTTQTQALSLLQRCSERGLIVEDAHVPFRFRFKHALIRKALADRLVVALAAPLHVRIATALEVRGDDAAHPAELAYHWSAARDAQKARMWNERAGAQAWRVYAYRDAIRFYSEALRWEYPPGPERALLYERLGTLHYIDGSSEEPATFYGRCRDEYERAGDADGAARAVWLLADQHWVDARTAQSLDAAADACARAARTGNRTLQGNTLLSLARFAVTLGKPEDALAYLEKARSFAGGFDAVARASVHEIRGETFAVLGKTRGALREMHRAAALAAATGSSEVIAQIENNFALGASDLGLLDLAVARHRRALEEAGRTAMMWRVAYSSLGFARTLALRGDLQAARRLIWEALETGVSTATFITKVAAVGIPVALMLNDLPLLEACAREEALDLARRSGEVQRIAQVTAAFAELRADQGSLREAQRLIADAVARISRPHRSWDFLICAAGFGAEEDVVAVRGLFSAAFGRPCVRRAYRLLFEAIALRQAQPDSAKRFAAAALAHFRSMGDVLHSAQAMELTGETAAALASYVKMGSVRDAERLAQKTSGETARRDLTPRQMEIARLVALGETNRGIAARLRISEHTVEHHISAIFERLNLRSRSQIAHAVGRGDPL